MAGISAGAGRGGAAVSKRGAAMPVGPWVYDRWVSKPAQNRSERTFFRLLDAAEGLLGGRHWHEVSVQEIVRKADASVGSFYNRFADKEALLHCLDDRLGQECVATVDGLLQALEDDASLRGEAAGIIVSLFMRLCSDRRGVIRALDLAQKMTASEAFSGLGPTFEASIDRLSRYLAEADGPLKGTAPAALGQAFKETFWLTREVMLYRDKRPPADALHRTLLRHFEASLEGWG